MVLTSKIEQSQSYSPIFSELCVRHLARLEGSCSFKSLVHYIVWKKNKKKKKVSKKEFSKKKNNVCYQAIEPAILAFRTNFTVSGTVRECTLKKCFFLTHLYTRWHRALLAMLVKLYFFKPTVLKHIKATWRSA